MFRLLCIAIFLASCQNSEMQERICYEVPKRILCDFENTVENKFKSNSDYKFGNSATQSNENKFKGKFSCRLDSSRIYGATLKLNVKPGDRFEIKVKRSANSFSSIIMSISGGNFISRKKGNRINDDWDEICLKTTVYSTEERPTAKIYLLYNKKDKLPVFFDDLEINFFGRDDTVKHPYISDSYIINMTPKDLALIKNARKTAFKTGIINDSLKFWVPIDISYNGKKQKAKFKIKGDWTEHLETDKWGAKIKVKSEIFGHKKFSIMKPSSRSGIREILYHEVLKEFNMLTTDCFLKGVKINGVNKGFFLVEEHFSENFLEKRSLEKTAILKIDEQKMWSHRDQNYYNNMFKDEGSKHYFKHEKIKNYIKCNGNRAEKLLHGFRTDSLPLDSVFELDYLTTFFAIANIFSAQHSLIWHNMRFYYDKQNKKLYPIAYDGYSHDNHLIRNSYIGLEKEDYLEGWNNLFLQNKLFLKMYYAKLNKYSNTKFINSVLQKHKETISSSLEKITKEQCDYKENFDFIFKNIKSYNSLETPTLIDQKLAH